MKIGHRIKELRKRAKITQPELAEKIGVHETTIRRWERDIDKGPGIEIAEKLAEALGTTVGVLMGETESAPPQKSENLPIDNAPETVNNQNENLGLGYWGSVADNARKVAARGDPKELSLVAALLQSAVDEVNGTAEKGVVMPQTVGFLGNNNKVGKNYVNA